MPILTTIPTCFDCTCTFASVALPFALGCAVTEEWTRVRKATDFSVLLARLVDVRAFRCRVICALPYLGHASCV